MGKGVWAVLLCLAALLPGGCGSAPPDPVRRTITILSALPLFLGEGDAQDVLNGPDQRAPIIAALARFHTLRPIVTVTPEALTGTGVLLIAQPRGLSPTELVALDGWVRAGGRALLFVDPRLDWPSRYPFGDPRRAPPVTLLDPLLTHWGLTLVAPPVEAGVETLEWDGLSAPLSGAGSWQSNSASCTLGAEARLADCRLGKGRALLLADADLLDLGEEGNAERRSMVEALIGRVATDKPL